MFCDLFNQDSAKSLLTGKKIWFCGSSNMRAIYKDLIWLMNKGNLAPQNIFRIKNEQSFLSDKRLSAGNIHNGTNYVETREYKNDSYLFFHFLTRLYLKNFVKIIEDTKDEDRPDVLIINSTLWDLTRWGSTSDSIQNYKINIVKTFRLLRTKFPTTRIIWKTALPVSPSATGTVFIDEVKSVVPMLPWHLLEANRYAAVSASFFGVDILDVHHYMRMSGYLRVKDGIHWNTVAVRYLTNVFLTHLSLSWKEKLPGTYEPSQQYLQQTSAVPLEKHKFDELMKNKKSLFDKLAANVTKPVKPLKVNKNPITKAKNIFKQKNKIAKKVKQTYAGNNQMFRNYSQGSCTYTQNANINTPSNLYTYHNNNPFLYHNNTGNVLNFQPGINAQDYSTILQHLDSQLQMVYRNILNYQQHFF